MNLTFQGAKGVEITREGSRMAEVARVGNMYVVRSSAAIPAVFSVQDLTKTGGNENASLWHYRLGHLGMGAVAKMSTLVDGVPSITLSRDECVCEACLYGKMARKPFPTLPATSRATAVLDIVHSDIMGPMEVPSISGARFILLFVDDRTRYKHCYILKRKSEALQSFKDYQTLVEKVHGKRIGRFRTDGGGEYTSQAFLDYLRGEGIRKETTTPYTPQSNGMSERANRTIIETAKAMMSGASVPKHYWAEAVSAAVYIRNLTPTRAIPEGTPHEAWFGVGKRPDLAHLRVWGCVAYAQVPKESRRKLDPNARKCIFIGYALTCKQYRLYDPVSKRLIVSRDVVFNEKESYHTCAVGERGERILHYIPTPIVPAEIPVYPGNAVAAHPSSPAMQPSASPRGSTPPVEPATELETITVAPAVTRGGGSRIVRELGGGTGESSGATGATGRRTRRSNAVVPPVDYTERDSSIDTMLMVEQGPATFGQAMATGEAVEWKEAIDSETASIEENGTFEDISELPPGKKAIPTKIILTRKLDPIGKPIRYKARLVAQGFRQTLGVDYHETYSPVADMASVRMALTIAAALDLKVEQLDVVTAFLGSELEEEVYVRLPDGILGGPRSVRLRKSLYGLKQSPRCWYITVDSFILSELGFTRCRFDTCMYIRESDGTMIVLYVDDLLIIGKADAVVEVRAKIAARFDVVCLGPVNHFLGMVIERDRTKGHLYLSQSGYIERILERMGLAECNGVSTPLIPKEKLIPRPKEADDSTEPKANQQHYQQAIGSLGWLAGASRPDIAYAVSLLGRFSQDPGETHWQGVKRVFRYVAGTKGLRLRLGGRAEVDLTAAFDGYVDADFAGDSKFRSTTGYIFRLGTSSVAWRSKKQTITALSTADAEFIASAAAIQELLWFRQLLCRLLRKSVLPPTVLYNDNVAALASFFDDKYRPHSRHIGVK